MQSSRPHVGGGDQVQIVRRAEVVVDLSAPTSTTVVLGPVGELTVRSRVVVVGMSVQDDQVIALRGFR